MLVTLLSSFLNLFVLIISQQYWIPPVDADYIYNF